MAYTLPIAIALKSSQTGLTLNGQLYDADHSASGAAIAAGFTEVGGGLYYLKASIPDGFSGTLEIYTAGTPGTIHATCAITPGEENLDVKVSTRGTGTALDAAGVRGAVGLAAANLDTQIGTLALEASLTAIKGAGWATETLHAIYDAIAAGVTAASVADAVWDEASADHVGAGSTGLKLSLLALEATLTAIKGAGWIAAENLHNIDALLDAIKAKTDLITTGTSITLDSRLEGDTITIWQGDQQTWTHDNVPVLAGWDKCYWTLKRRRSDLDTEAILKIEYTAGLQVLNASGTVTAANASLAVTDNGDGTADVAPTLKAPTAAALAAGGGLHWDIEWVDTTVSPPNVYTPKHGDASVTADVTKAIT